MEKIHKLRNKLVVLLTKSNNLTKMEVEAIEYAITLYDVLIDTELNKD